MAKLKDITGQRFGRLVAIECVGIDEVYAKAIWKCKCDCGNTVNVIGRNMVKGNTHSCGCIKNEYCMERIMQELDITQTAYAYIKKKLGYKKYGTKEMFEHMKSVVDDLKKYCDHLTVKTIDKYWGVY